MSLAVTAANAVPAATDKARWSERNLGSGASVELKNLLKSVDEVAGNVLAEELISVVGSYSTPFLNRIVAWNKTSDLQNDAEYEQARSLLLEDLKALNDLPAALLLLFLNRNSTSFDEGKRFESLILDAFENDLTKLQTFSGKELLQVAARARQKDVLQAAIEREFLADEKKKLREFMRPFEVREVLMCAKSRVFINEVQKLLLELIREKQLFHGWRACDIFSIFDYKMSAVNWRSSNFLDFYFSEDSSYKALVVQVIEELLCNEGVKLLDCSDGVLEKVHKILQDILDEAERDHDRSRMREVQLQLQAIKGHIARERLMKERLPELPNSLEEFSKPFFRSGKQLEIERECSKRLQSALQSAVKMEDKINPVTTVGNIVGMYSSRIRTPADPMMEIAPFIKLVPKSS